MLESVSAYPFIVMGFSLGAMHALDADHIMAVSSLSNNRPGYRRMIRYCLNWALGHGGILLLAGMLLFGVGVNLPEPITLFADICVGLLLIVLGGIYFWRARTQGIQFSAHSHGDISHSHWHKKNAHLQASEKDSGADHAPVMVGMLHGLAGSAPVLALVPVMGQGQVSVALLYLLVFSLGMTLSMFVFGLGFGAVQKKIQAKYHSFFRWQRHIIASCSVLVGLFWIGHAVN